MDIRTSELYRLLSFEFGITQVSMREHCGATVSLWLRDSPIDDIAPRIDEGLTDLFGKDYKEIRNIKMYQRHQKTVDDVNPKAVTNAREDVHLNMRELADITGLRADDISKIESGARSIPNWKNYQRLKKVLRNDLLRSSSRFKAKPKKGKKTKQFMTFKNIATRGSKVCLETGRRIVI